MYQHDVVTLHIFVYAQSTVDSSALYLSLSLVEHTPLKIENRAKRNTFSLFLTMVAFKYLVKSQITRSTVVTNMKIHFG